MWKCNSCGALTNQPPVTALSFFQGDKPVEIEIPTGCDCGGDFESAFECEECGAYYSAYDEVRGGCCVKCTDKVKKELRDFMKRHSKAQQNCIHDLMYYEEY